MRNINFFYSSLREYNISHFPVSQSWPRWCTIYQSPQPPVYWTRLAEMIKKFPQTLFCVEIGCGLGDILALLIYLGYTNIKGIEKEPVLVDATNKKLFDLFGIKNTVVLGKYPFDLEICPDILIQLNCVYHENICNKTEYLSQISTWHTWNGIPKAYIVELLDSSFTQYHPAYPPFVRVSESDIQNTFKEYTIQSSLSYLYPFNSSTKRIYCVRS